MLSVGVFGSCRVHTPLKIAGDNLQLRYVFDNVFGYMHNTKEMLQAIRALRSEITIPPSVSKLVNLTNPDILGTEDLFSRHYQDVDLFVVEISSVRVINYIQTQLQINKFREALLEGEGGDLAAKALFRSVTAWRDVVTRYIEQNALKPELVSILQSATLHEQNASEVETDLLEIARLLAKPVVFVSFFTNDFAGQPIPQRIVIREAIERARARSSVIGHYDPTPLVESGGKDEVLIDLGHYKPEFEPIVAQRLAAEVINFARTV